jgi:myo-inositol-1(or 4)-monophosphatase
MESKMVNESSKSLTERELGTLKEFVENTLRKSGMLLMEIFGKGARKLRFDERLVTEADNAAWELISSKIKGSFEAHGFLRELDADQIGSEDCPRFLWIIDTLDGAASFQAGMPVWGISAALFEKFWPVLGFLYLPVTGELYSAYAARQALLNDKPIAVRDEYNIDNESLALVYSRFHQDFSSNFPGKIRNFGSSAGHMAYVARGAADVCFMKKVNVQDLAAGSIILEAAGGEITYFDGRPFHVGDYLDGKQVEGPLIASPKGSWEYFIKYFSRV